MKNMIKIAGVAAVALALTQSIQAIPVSGNIGFAGQVTLNSSSAGTASAVTGWVNPHVEGDSGSFSGIADNTPVTFTGSTWNFTTVSAINPFWSVDGFTFVLTSSWILSQGGSAALDNGYVVVDGWGYVTGNGYAQTEMFWTFSISDPQANTQIPDWSFQASATSVPDGGATVMLLGIALSGVALLKKKLMA
jgi:hypothetical protein